MPLRRRGQLTLAPRRLSALVVALAGVAACGPAAPASDRYISAYDGSPAPERVWRRESGVRIDPDAHGGMVIWEVTAYPPGAAPSAEQRRAADQLVAASRRAAEAHGWYRFENAVEQGYQLIFLDKTHYAKHEFLLDEHILDPERPEILMYYGGREKRLAGFMFYMGTPTGRGPQFAGPLSVWHYHTWPYATCMLEGLVPLGMPDAEQRCPYGVPSQRSPEMIHVWLVEHPDGPFATNMGLPGPVLKELLARPPGPERPQAGSSPGARAGSSPGG